MSINTKDDNLFRYIHYKPAQLTEKLKAEVQKEAERRKKKEKTHRELEPANSEREKQIKALHNLEALDLTKDTNFKDHISHLVLNKNGHSKLSAQTRSTLESLGLDTIKMSHLELVNNLNNVLARPDNTPPTPSPEPPQDDSQGYIQDVGTAKLLVVKQQILRYEASEIAHIENVLAGETKTRTHSKLTRSEEFSSFVSDTTTDTETELETTERFELNKQVSKTFQKDTELGMELTVSGKYGPTVSFDSNFNAGQSTSQTTSNEQATNFAKDTIERSKERIVEQITTTRERTLIREINEVNKHKLKNGDPKHKFAIYQYVDKIYESQVFDYGIRQMFDFMIPEPSSYLWYLKEKTAFQLDIPPPTPLKDMGISVPRHITKFNYQSLGAQYGVNDLPAPPEIYITKRIRMAQGGGSVSDSNVHKTGVSETLPIPAGYHPISATFSVLATSDDRLYFSINIGGKIIHISQTEFLDEQSVEGGHKKYSFTSNEIGFGFNTSLDVDENLFIDIYGYESANYTFHFEVTFYALYDTSQLEYFNVSAWKQEVYGMLVEAYQTALREYEQEKSFLEAEADAETGDKVDFGSPPAINKKLINTELKKHCLTIIHSEPFGTFTTSHPDTPPKFNLSEAKENGEKIRFLEQAFEWDQMQYVFYPYFWARPNFSQDPDDPSNTKGWTDKFFEKNNDFTMEEFLKAGSARVVVPVREGFDLAVSHFIQSGEVYFGLGEPSIIDPLYVSITDEIRERTGAGKGEIPVGDSWETRLPTAAIIVKDVDELPKWVKVLGEEWKWEPE
jgi:hypothetical protein